jgi:hypothetical protein
MLSEADQNSDDAACGLALPMTPQMEKQAIIAGMIDDALKDKKTKTNNISDIPIYENSGQSGINMFGAYTIGKQFIGFKNTKGNLNFSASSVVFKEDQNSIVIGIPDANISLGSSEKIGSVDAFIGIKNGNTIGIGAMATGLGIEGNLKISLFGYGLGLNGSVNVLTVGAGFQASTKMLEVKVGLLLGASIRLSAISP